MEKIKEAVMEGSKSRATVIGQFLVILGGLMFVPMFHNQLFAGPVVNALLFIVTVMLGLRFGLLLSIVPSGMALFYGLLPAVLIPFIPFIMVSNMIMVGLFKVLKDKNFFLGVVISSVTKFLFLFLTHQMLFKIFLKKDIALAASTMMSWNQLYTALLGGLIAFGFLKFIKRI